MQTVLKWLKFSIVLVVFIGLYGQKSQAQLSTKISVLQNMTQLSIEVEVQSQSSSETLFILSEKAIIEKNDGFSITKNEAGQFILKLEHRNAAQIKYSLGFDQDAITYLTEDLNWYPKVQNEVNLQTFDVLAKVDSGFQVIHSATGQNQSGVSLVFGRFIKYEGTSKKIAVYLQKEDSDLASVLISNLENYLTTYETQFGPYPYDQFSVVESSDEVGFAFPRMTWIGSRLLRFPFILKTSLPHELLHSWWGNSVFVDYNKGNWCEGLTVFGADYALLSEAEKITYRQKALLEYMDYVKAGNEISLAEFISREEDRSLQAIGYNKSLMMFVMLEQLVGVNHLKQALSDFSHDNRFKVASYGTLFEILKQVSTENLDEFYQTWILQKGALDFQSVKGFVNSNEVQFTIDPLQAKKLNGLKVNVLINFVDETSQKVQIDFATKQVFAKKPKSFILDPDYQLFRKMSEAERPLSFSKLFASSLAQIIANAETVSTVQTVFPTVSFAAAELKQIDFSNSGIVMLENYRGGSSDIDAALKEKSVQILPDAILFGSENLSLSQNSYFVSLKVKSKMVVLFKTNTSLPLKRWFERWSRYGAQGYLVLTPTAAAKQGIWNNHVVQDFE